MRIGLHLDVSGRSLSPSSFTPASLFASSEQGAWYDPSDLSSMFQDSGGVTPAAVDQPVGRINDKSGRGNHLSQATTASKPILRLASGRYYLEFDGVDDGMFTGSAMAMTASDALNLVAGVRKTSDAAGVGVIAEFGPSVAAGGQFALFAPSSGGANRFNWVSSGTVAIAAPVTSATYNAPVTVVFTGQGRISTDTCISRINGAVINSVATDQGTGNYASLVLNVGRRNNISTAFTGYLYGLVIRGGVSSADEVTALETYMNTKTGAY